MNMANPKRLSLLMGLAAIATVGSALPAAADDVKNQDAFSAISSEAFTVDFDSVLNVETGLSPVDPAVEPAAVEVTETAEAVESPAVLPVEVAEVNAAEASVTPAPVAATTEVVIDEAVAVSADYLLEPAKEITVADGLDLAMFNNTLDSTLEAEVLNSEESDLLAQATRGGYQGVAPMYFGVGGNLGFGDRDQSGIASMGFTLISKISLGPRFALRPAVLFTNDNTSFTVPLTYNFNTTQVGNVRLQPYLGVGADFPSGGNVNVMFNAGTDIPISRDFTINAVTNWRFFDGFAFGMTIGIGYNFPFIFE